MADWSTRRNTREVADMPLERSQGAAAVRACSRMASVKRRRAFWPKPMARKHFGVAARGICECVAA